MNPLGLANIHGSGAQSQSCATTHNSSKQKSRMLGIVFIRVPSFASLTLSFGLTLVLLLLCFEALLIA